MTIPGIHFAKVEFLRGQQGFAPFRDRMTRADVKISKQLVVHSTAQSKINEKPEEN